MTCNLLALCSLHSVLLYVIESGQEFNKLFRLWIDEHSNSKKSFSLSKNLPSYIGTVCETPSPESNTIPVVLPDAYKERTA